MQLSNNLTLAEVVKSQTAVRHSIDNSPDEATLANLKRVAQNIFQPLRDHFDHPLAVTSGYRCEELNKRIGGSASSAHCRGEALDIDADVFGKVSNRQIFDYIRNNMEFDQLIYEFGDEEQPDWVHVSQKESDNRKQVLRAVKSNGRTSYIPF